MEDIYFFGECVICHKSVALKNGICAECGNKPLKCDNKGSNDMPDFFTDVLDRFSENNINKI